MDRVRIPGPPPPDNASVSAALREIGDLLADQGANPFRARAYRHAADVVHSLERPVAAILAERGIEGLESLPGIGESLAGAIREIVATGHLGLLDRLRGTRDPLRMLQAVPGVGRTLADRIHHELDVSTLAELEVAAHDGRLEAMDGIGEKKLQAIRHYLAGRLGRRGVTPPPAHDELPPVAELLDVDRVYRTAAAKGRLERIAPRRFNPTHEAWLPILHTARADRHYMALFSNTATAHRLGRTRDWVVLYVDGGRGERQCTVVTQHGGPLDGKRVVRGRELECRAYYAAGGKGSLPRSTHAES